MNNFTGFHAFLYIYIKILKNKMDNSLPVVGDINHKYIVTERSMKMKDFIVLIAVIVLGLFIGGIVLNFRGKATALGGQATTAIDSFTNSL